MPFICKGICTNSIYESKKSARGKFLETHKKCAVCCLFLKDVGIFCPCCRNRMKHSPVKSKSRQLYRERNSKP